MDKRLRIVLPAIALAGLLLRLAVRLHSGSADFWRNGYTFYFELARNIAAGRGLAFDGEPLTAFRVPMYPMFLAAVTLGHKAFLSVVFAQSLIGAATVLCGALLAAELFGSTAGITTAVLAAAYPYYVVHDTALQDTSLFTLLTLLSVLLLIRVRRSMSAVPATLAGFVLGTAVLTRATIAPFASKYCEQISPTACPFRRDCTCVRANTFSRTMDDA